MRIVILVLALAFLAGCSENPSSPSAKPGDKPAGEKRSIGMPEDIWKVYSGAESGGGDAPKDKPEEKK